MNTKIKDCPFCGNTKCRVVTWESFIMAILGDIGDEIYDEYYDAMDDYCDGYIVECTAPCMAKSGWAGTKAAAINKWNARVDSNDKTAVIFKRTKGTFKDSII
jgi:hypothetical protein